MIPKTRQERLGKEIAEMLVLKKDKAGHYQTQRGKKSNAGLCLAIEEMFNLHGLFIIRGEYGR